MAGRSMSAASAALCRARSGGRWRRATRTVVSRGCRRRRFLEIHHVVHWADGGETSPENTLRLCLPHHRLEHEGGFRIDKDYLGNWYFVRPDGKAIPPNGYRPEDMLDQDIHASATGSIDVSAAGPADPCHEGWTDPSAEGFSRTIGQPSAEGWQQLARRLAAQPP